MRAQPRVLASDLNGDGSAFGGIHSRGPADQIAGRIAERIVKGDDQKNHCAGSKETVSVIAHDPTDDAGKSDYTDRRHDSHGFPIGLRLAEEEIQECADSDGDQRDDQNALEHSPCVDMHRFSCQPFHQQRRHDGSQKRARRRHSDAERHIPVGKIAHGVAGDAARTGSHDQDAYRDSLREMEKVNEAPGEKRHQRVLCARADENVQRTLRENPEIVLGERHAHGQHDDAQDDSLCCAFHPQAERRIKIGGKPGQNDKNGGLVRKNPADFLKKREHDVPPDTAAGGTISSLQKKTIFERLFFPGIVFDYFRIWDCLNEKMRQ